LNSPRLSYCRILEGNELWHGTATGSSLVTRGTEGKEREQNSTDDFKNLPKLKI